MKHFTRIGLFSLIFCVGCIGTDFIDDPIVGAMILIDGAKSALLIDQTVQLHATYYNEYGVEEEVTLSWTSDHESVEVDDMGLATAKSKGQANIYATFEGVVSPSFLVTVVGDADEVASVQVLAPKNNLGVEEMLQLTIETRNFNGDLIEVSSPVTWMSSNSNVVSVDGSGVVTGEGNGVAEVVARVEDVNSPPLLLTVGEQERTGAFMGSGGYTAEGTAMLSYDQNTELILTLSSDFKTSFALGTFIYLSNDTGGGATRTGGLEIAEITTNGGKTFNVSDIDASVSIDAYKYVVVLCKPASITFGYAELEP